MFIELSVYWIDQLNLTVGSFYIYDFRIFYVFSMAYRNLRMKKLVFSPNFLLFLNFPSLNLSSMGIEEQNKHDRYS